MCTRVITADEATKLVGRPACVTHKRLLIPFTRGEITEASLAVYTVTNQFRMDKRGIEVIDRNPLAPVDCDTDGQQKMLISMGLGLSQEATILWVHLLKNFVPGMAKRGDSAQEVNGETMTQMLSDSYAFGEMPGVEVALPCKATHWLVCQPIAGAEILDWQALDRDALGVWQTEENVYFVVPAGYQNVLFDVLDDSAEFANKDEFFESNSKQFRKDCQTTLDAWTDAERARKKNLPALLAQAEDLVAEYGQAVQKAMPQCFGEDVPPALQLDTESELLVYGDVSERLTDLTLEKYANVLKQLQQQVTEFELQSRRVDGFRDLLRDLERAVTVKDVYGVLEQTAAPGFGNNVEVELAVAEAIITVRKRNGEVKSQRKFAYGENRSASDFNAELKRLKLKHDEYYDFDQADTLRTSGWHGLRKVFSRGLA